jgi:hypothetical protein
MKRHRSIKRRKTGNRKSEAGQAMIFLVLALAIFLLASLAFAIDMGNLWFHRQAAQTTADAACTSAAMDMLYTDTGVGSSGGFTAGTNFSCGGTWDTAASSSAPCVYAAKNMGGAASSLTAGRQGYDVHFTFPASFSGLQSCTTGTGAPAICNDPSAVANNFVQVNVDDRAPLFFAGLVSGAKTADVGAQSTCGVVLSNAPIPLLVLDPRNESSMTNNGAFNIQIVGGPQRSIQVDAASTTAVSVAGTSGSIDLTHGGPNNSGSDFGVTGSEAVVGVFHTAGSGQWIDPAPAISDPFAQIPAPSQPAPAPAVNYNQTGAAAAAWGCPDTVNGCDHYHPGYYASGITVKTGKPTGSGATGLAVFDPGLYYMGGNLAADSNSCLRPSTATGDGSGGTLFYFSGTATANVTSNSGTLVNHTGPTVTFDCQDLNSTTPPTINNAAWAVSLAQVKCITSGTGTTILPANVITLGGLVGNVLLGPCQAPTAGGTNYGDPLGINDPLGEQRGMLFFQDRSATNVLPLWSGGGAFGLAGNLYFHNCSTANNSGNNCDQTNGFTDKLELGGGSSSSTFVVGDIVTDQLYLHGNPQIEMDLNPNALYYVLKASLLQ